MNVCFVCFEPVSGGQYHHTCCRKIFGTPLPPVCDLKLDELPLWALRELGGHHALTGAQRKVSAHWSSERAPFGHARWLTMVGAMGGRFILKPESPDYSHMPWNEAVTMAMARRFGIATAPSALLRLADGSLAYCTQRFDRSPRLAKIPCEDMAQLSGTLTEDKYRGSIEKIGEVLLRWSAQPGVDTARLFSLTVFCFVSGNSDMHLKNFSLLQANARPVLSPAYDLLNVAVYLQDEDSALSLNGKRRRLRGSDFWSLAKHLGVSEKYVDSTLRRLVPWWADSRALLETDLVPSAFAHAYQNIVEERLKRLGV